MITGRQVRAARALLNWKQEMLAEKALVALTALKRLESERQLQVHEGTRDQVRRVSGSRRDPLRRIRPWPRRHAPPRGRAGNAASQKTGDLETMKAVCVNV